jgi:hypothetical protein
MIIIVHAPNALVEWLSPAINVCLTSKTVYKSNQLKIAMNQFVFSVHQTPPSIVYRIPAAHLIPTLNAVFMEMFARHVVNVKQITWMIKITNNVIKCLNHKVVCQ